MTRAGEPRRRRRLAKSCEPCRRRKVRCDQALPCTPCNRSRGQISCHYRKINIRDVSGAAGVQSGETSKTSYSVLPAETVSQVPQNMAMDDAEQISRQFNSNRSQNTQVEPRLCQVGTSDSHQHQGGPTLRLRNKPEKQRLYGQSHWIYAAEMLPVVIGNLDTKEGDISFKDVEAEADTDTGTTDLVGLFEKVRKIRLSVKSQQTAKAQCISRDLLNSIPPRAICDKLVANYLRTLGPIYGVIHVTSFKVAYEKFWIEPKSSQVPVSFVMKLISLMAIGSTFYYGSGGSDIRKESSVWIYAAQEWLSGRAEKSTMNLEGLQVCCLIIIAKQTTFLSRGLVWLSAGSLLTMAMSMGLHRDPALFPSLSTLQVELRKRLWAATLELTIQSHLDSAIPLLISASDFDTPAPMNVRDEDLSDRTRPFPEPEENLTEVSLQIRLCESLPLRLEVVRLLNGIHFEESYDRILSLGLQLRDAGRKMSSFFDETSASSVDHSTVKKFHRRFIDVYLLRFHMLLHRPFMIMSQHNANFFLARKLCVESAMVMASYASDIATAMFPQQADDLSRLNAVGRGLFKGPLSLDVILVLSLEMSMQLEDQGVGLFGKSRLDKMQKTARDAITVSLQGILARALDAIRGGSVSFKSFGFLGPLLAQYKAIENSHSVKAATYSSILESLTACLDALESYGGKVVSEDMDEVNLHSEASTETAAPLPFDFESLNDYLDWDVTMLLGTTDMESV